MFCLAAGLLPVHLCAGTWQTRRSLGRSLPLRRCLLLQIRPDRPCLVLSPCLWSASRRVLCWLCLACPFRGRIHWSSTLSLPRCPSASVTRRTMISLSPPPPFMIQRRQLLSSLPCRRSTQHCLHLIQRHFDNLVVALRMRRLAFASPWQLRWSPRQARLRM